MALNCISWIVLYLCQQLTIEENMKGIHWSLMDSTHKGRLVMQSFDGFYPRPVLAFGYCRCLRLSVCVSVCVCRNHMLVSAITHHPFELGSPNLDHRCKRPWLRSLLFLGLIELHLSNLTIFKNSFYLHHFCVFEIFVRPARMYENGVCSTS